MLTSGILTSWKEIAGYMGKGVRTVQRWEQDFGLPVRRPRGADKKAVLARSSDLDAWLALRCSTRTNCKREVNANSAMVIVRTRIAAEVATAHMLREQNRAIRAEMRTALELLREHLTTMCKKAA